MRLASTTDYGPQEALGDVRNVHTPHWHGNVLLWAQQRVDVVSVSFFLSNISLSEEVQPVAYLLICVTDQCFVRSNEVAKHDCGQPGHLDTSLPSSQSPRPWHDRAVSCELTDIEQ